jgi:hypothetical protein
VNAVILSILVDGYRGFSNQVWNLVSITPADQSNFDTVSAIIDTFHGTNYIEIPALTMNQYSTFTFNFQFTNGFGGSGVNSFIIKTSGADGLSLEMTQMDSNLFNIW